MAGKTLRTKTGCLACRRKKCKCDEMRPVCERCRRSGVFCQWPSAGELMDRRNKSLRERNRGPDHHGEPSGRAEPGGPGWDGNQSPSTDKTPPPDDKSLTLLQQENTNPFMQISTTIFGSWRHQIPGTTLSRAELHHLERFVRSFLPAITPPHAHSRLRPLTVFVPCITLRHELLDLFLACGAVDGSWGNQALRNEALVYYSSFLRKWKQAVSVYADGAAEDWVLVTIQLTLLLDKHIGAPCNRIVNHVAAGYALLQQQSRDGAAASLWTGKTATGRVLTESFLYNYVVSILFVDEGDLERLPPCGTFKAYCSVLKNQIFASETVTWANNPVFGASVELFCKIEKISWLFRSQPLSESEIAEARVIYQELEDWSFDSVEPSALMQFEGARIHHYASVLYNVAGRLVLLKLLDPMLEETSEKVRGLATSAMSYISRIKMGDRSGCIGGMLAWALAMVGIACVEEMHRNVIRQKCFELGEVLHAAFANHVMQLCEAAWGGLGMGVLYRRDILAKCSV